MIIGLGIGIPFIHNYANLAISQAFSPADLFANGEQGAWYDPSDLSTLFQDAAGTTPVTAVEQPVGLMLDKSKGLVLGPELVTNGGFDSDTWWQKDVGVTISGGSANYSSVGVNFAVYKSGLLSIGYYQVTYTVTSISSGSLSANIAGSVGSNVAKTSPGTYTEFIYNSLASAGFGIGARSAGTTASIDNVSIRQIIGNHAFQTTATSRPVLSARYNLLTKTEVFSDAVWLKTGGSVMPNTLATNDPLGGNAADLFVENSSNSEHRVVNLTAVPVITGIQYTSTIYAKRANGSRNIVFYQLTTSSGWAVYVDLSNGSVVSSVSIGGGVGSATATASGDGWYEVILTFTPNAGGNVVSCGMASGTSATYTGDGTSGIYIWGASLVPANQADLPYQRVNTATDYDAGPAFPRYLRCDGIDDGMVTGTITPGTDKAQVFAGVRKLSDAARGIVVEQGDPSVRGVNLNAPDSAASNFSIRSYSATLSGAPVASGYPAPITNVVTGLADISGDSAIIRINGTQAEQSTTDQGTGNYLAYPLYLFRRGGTSLPFNGHFYGGIIRFGDNLPIETIQQTEAYMAAKTGVTL